MRRLSETAKTWLAVIPVAIAAAYVGRRAAELHNQEIENWMAIEAINWHVQELKQWQMERQMERARVTGQIQFAEMQLVRRMEFRACSTLSFCSE
ncbi:unnamed protein product [Camellia sinensis]